MLPNEVKSAIPRQKVKHIESGEIFYVIGLHPTEKQWAMLLTMDGFKDEAPLGNLEPVPEEPSPFRCGDAVFVRGTVVPGEDADKYGIYSRISGISKDGKCKIIDRLDWVGKDGIRHATPSEVAQYFNQHA